ncbi:hypothetical protein [Pyrobaculum aerophilum]|uniref:hypothetical protein n=1 Tax=Pyrobaculum aerophilum TaxID=13773 RepID=UPI0021639549|nr:hypothetical protein [Pyrobaculum aerophilum]
MLTLFIAPLLWRQRHLVEEYAGKRIKELKATVAYERLYRVVTHAFITAAKLAVLMVAIALAVGYLGLVSLAVLIPSSYFFVKYSREIYKDLLIALRELEEARYASIAVLTSTLSLALYVAVVLLQPVLQEHIYIVVFIMGILGYSLYVIYRELQRERTIRLSSSTT